MKTNPCLIRYGQTDLYWCVSCWKGLNGLDEVAEHLGDKSRFGDWKKKQLDDINAEIRNLQTIAARFKKEKPKGEDAMSQQDAAQ
jgi:hypothetical protein